MASQSPLLPSPDALVSGQIGAAAAELAPVGDGTGGGDVKRLSPSAALSSVLSTPIRSAMPDEIARLGVQLPSLLVSAGDIEQGEAPVSVGAPLSMRIECAGVSRSCSVLAGDM